MKLFIAIAAFAAIFSFQMFATASPVDADELSAGRPPSRRHATLLTGGASRTGTAIAKLLRASGREVLFAARRTPVPPGFNSVRFDWHDPSTFTAPWDAFPGKVFDAVYLLPPPQDERFADAVESFIDLAVAKGSKRFIFLTSSDLDMSLAPYVDLARVHKYLHDQGLDYFVLRPTWFMENFVEALTAEHRTNEVVSSVATGKIPFVAVEDIAQVAFEAIVSRTNAFTEKTIIGPELMTYDEAAVILSRVLRRPITYTTVSSEEMVLEYQRLGYNEYIANVLVGSEAIVEQGSQEHFETRAPKLYVGKTSLKKWTQKNRRLMP